MLIWKGPTRNTEPNSQEKLTAATRANSCASDATGQEEAAPGVRQHHNMAKTADPANGA